ncbi:MAG TPA: cytochrome c [Coriobacteriia bacterium]|nr:cytochrome c [Coriobacteriia bacterium]
MKHSRILTLALVLVLVGVAGFAATALLVRGSVLENSFASVGERIYYTGMSTDGRIPRSVARTGRGGMRMMGNAACVDCHGEDGRGGRFGMMRQTVEVPDVRYSTLARSHTEDGETHEAWTDADIARAIREGVEPNGENLKAPMPRWEMSDDEVADVIDYLKELSQ